MCIPGRTQTVSYYSVETSASLLLCQQSTGSRTFVLNIDIVSDKCSIIRMWCFTSTFSGSFQSINLEPSTLEYVVNCHVGYSNLA